MEMRTKKKEQVETEIEEQEDIDPTEIALSEEDKKLIALHEELVKVYGDKAPLLSQIEAWKSRYTQLHVSKVGTERKEYYVWRTLKRYEYKEMLKGTDPEDANAFNEMLVEKCILYPIYEFQFRNQSDAGVIHTLGQQISYKSGFVSPEEALSLVYII